MKQQRPNPSALVLIEQKLQTCHIFDKQSKEKREELADAIYMSALRAKLPFDSVLRIIRSSEALDEGFFSANCGNIFSYIKEEYREFAKRIFLKRAGGGTPNAAMGKAELLLLLFSDKTEKPTKGDISFGGRQIEVKTNGGKIGLGNGGEVNQHVVAYCSRSNIQLPTATRGKVAKGNLQFIPADSEHRTAVGRHLSKVLAAWWKGLTGEIVRNPSWQTVRKAFLQRIAEETLPNRATQLLVFDKHGNFQLFKTPSALVRYYNKDSLRFEIRGYQKNPISIYLDIFSK